MSEAISPLAAARLAEASILLTADKPRWSGLYPVEHDPIRRYCHMVDLRDSRYLGGTEGDSNVATRAICPPSLVPYFAMPGPWPPSPPPFPPINVGTSRLNLAQEVWWSRPVRTGERLSCQFGYSKVFHKAIGVDPDAIWYAVERRIWDASGTVICIHTDNGVAFTPSREPPAPGGARSEPKIEGVPLDPFELQLDSRRVVLATSGTQDWYELHYDADYAKERGQPGPVLSNVFMRAMVDRLAAEWSADCRISSLSLQIRRAVVAGETLRLSGLAMPGASPENGGTLQVWFETGAGRCAGARVELVKNEKVTPLD